MSNQKYTKKPNFIGLAKYVTMAAAIGFCAAVHATLDLPKEPPKESIPRPLTAEELYYAGLFGKEIDPKIVELHAGPTKIFSDGLSVMQVLAQTFNGHQIAFYGKNMLSLDFGKEKHPMVFGTNIHEMVHIWQFQTAGAYTPIGHCQLGHGYHLRTGDKFEDFCTEKQASIVEDYARRFLMPDKAYPSNWYYKEMGFDSKENDALLIEIVEQRFPEAKKMREKIGRRENLPDARHAPEGHHEKKKPEPKKQPPKASPPTAKPDNDNAQPPAKAPEKAAEPQKTPLKAPEKVPEKAVEQPPKAEPKPQPPKAKPKPPPEKKKKPEMDDKMKELFDDTFKDDPNDGKPAFYCDALELTLSKTNKFIAGLKKSSNPTFSAGLDAQKPLCNVFNDKTIVKSFSGQNFTEYGLIENEPLADLANKIVKYIPRREYTAVQAFLKQEADRVKENLKKKDVTDPSQPDTERLFLFEQIRIYNALNDAIEAVTLPPPSFAPVNG